MTIGTRIYTFFKGALVGTDTEGNRYYKERRPRKNQKERRWVMYGSEAEASLVPAIWHGWLHYSTDLIPSESSIANPTWQKGHLPNQTGSNNAYRPPGHTLNGGKREKATGDYEAWNPSQIRKLTKE
ncbi:MAG: NADH:ubiquinone oxidoreductase subunit NDUFA12 [Pseudomonadota bacterium]|nr:NADH:ubiquinone oxidoreductase subunit NDUFA12 [Pseudomonadota bacterium]